jgi:UBX domain-containing protein 1
VSICELLARYFVFTRPLYRGSRRRNEEEEVRSGPFQGAGHRLGDEETPSTVIPDQNTPAGREMETAVRVITFWRNGFTIEDGPLLTYDDPQNAQLLELINSG